MEVKMNYLEELYRELGLSLQRLFEAMDRLFFGTRANTTEPITEVFYDDEEGITRILFELPGVEREGISLEASEDRVELSAKGEGRSYRASLRLDRRVEPTSAKAELRNGILELRLKLIKDRPSGFSIPIE